MRNVLYLNNFMTDEIVHIRNNQNIYSQPANNKIAGITEALLENDCKVKILSSGLVNGKTGKLYKKIMDKALGIDVVYCSIVDFPFINTISSVFFTYQQIKKENKKNKIDNIIFYNYKPEVAWAAWLAKKRLHIPITVEYEDGYAHVSSIHGVKAWIFNFTETVVKKCVDSAILVNSQLKKKYSVPTITVRGIVNKEFYKRCNAYRKKENDKFTILYSGGLDKERGIDVFLDSLKYFDDDCHVIITGKGTIQSDDKRVDFKGFIPYEKVQELMMQSDLLVQCQLSKNKFSGVSFPSKLFEYIATGNMIVSSDIKEVKTFAEDAFVYYDNDDPKKLANAIKYLMKKNYLTQQITDKIKMLCEENVPESVGKNILGILS